MLHCNGNDIHFLWNRQHVVVQYDTRSDVTQDIKVTDSICHVRQWAT